MAAMFLVLLLATQPAQQDLISAVDVYRNAIVAGQRGVLADLLHDDFSITAGDGTRRDKAGELNDLVVAELKVHEFRLDEPRYRTAGNTGIVTGILRWRMTFQGRESSIERRTTMTWVRKGGRWRLLAQHVSRLK
jgi:ketosteroid isomerase-like protein